jgi:outer membrane protein assembly factor BamB
LWCAHLGDRPVRAGGPLATLVLPDNGVVALTPGPPRRLMLSRLAAADGSLRWRRTVRVSGGDFLGDLGHGSIVAGGVPAWRLVDPAWLARRPGGTAVIGVSARSGAPRWGWRAPAGTAVHLLGADPSLGLVVLMSWGPGGGRVFALDRRGSQVWSTQPFPGFHLDATLRSGQVLVRAHGRLAGYDARTGRLLWSVPTSGQFFPYGFEIDEAPSLDGRHVLLGTTTALRSLDLHSGVMSSYPLPRDGINTTYWPYQVAVTDRLVAVVTNTGAVVLRRGRFPR